MDISCNQENLRRALEIVNRATDSRNGFSAVSLATDWNTLQLRAGDQDMTLTAWIACDVNKKGKTTVQADLLTQIVKCLDRTRVDLEHNPKKTIMKLTAGRNVCNVYSTKTSGQETNHAQPLQNQVSFDMDPQLLYQAIRRTYFSSEKVGQRIVLNGLNFSLQGKFLTVAAADGFRLSIQRIELPEAPDQDVNVIIPNKVIRELSRLLPSASDPVTIALGRHKDPEPDQEGVPPLTRGVFTVKGENVQIHYDLIQGRFPDYHNLIPQSVTTRMTMNHQQLLDAVKHSSMFCKEASNILRLKIETQEGESDDRPQSNFLTLMASAQEVGEMTEPVDIADLERNPEVENPASRIAFHYKYIEEALTATSRKDQREQNIVMEINDEKGPGMLRLPDDPDFTHILMPMFVQW